jgi:hypothetical protein
MAVVFLAVILAAAGTPCRAQTVNVPVNVNAPLASSAQLTLSPTVINFSDADPSTVPSIPANENPVQITASAQTGLLQVVNLRALAQGDLVSGSNTIAISSVTWTASGSGFRAGTMSRSSSQLVGQWLGPGTRTGTLSFFLNNSWSYATGNYTQRATFTLTAP